jgi:hypothetical protein
MQIWTAKTIRQELPRIVVKVERVRYYATLSGRLNDFATVTIVDRVSPPKRTTSPLIAPGTPLHPTHHVHWLAVACALNRDGVLNLGRPAREHVHVRQGGAQ